MQLPYQFFTLAGSFLTFGMGLCLGSATVSPGRVLVELSEPMAAPNVQATWPVHTAVTETYTEDDVHDRAQATAEAIRRGIIKVPE